jgi:hypothetical protein
MQKLFYLLFIGMLSFVLLQSSCASSTSTKPVIEQTTPSPSTSGPSSITEPQVKTTSETSVATHSTVSTTSTVPKSTTITVGFSPTASATDPTPKNLPAGTALIAFTRYTNAAFEESIFTVKNNGTDLKQLTTEKNVQEHFPDFSPDGKKIVFAKMVKGGQFDIYIMNSDGSGRLNLTNTPDIREDMPAWSPDGQQIAYSLSNDIYVMAADGTKPVRLTTDKGFDWVPVWSPDGKEIAFLSNRDGNWKWWVMKADGSNQRLLADIVVMEETQGIPVFLLKGTWSSKFPDTFFCPLFSKDRQCVISINVEKGKQGNITWSDSKNYLEVPGNNSPVVTLFTAKTGSFDIYNALGTPVKEIVCTTNHEIAGSCVALSQESQPVPSAAPTPASPIPQTKSTLSPLDSLIKGVFFADWGPNVIAQPGAMTKPSPGLYTLPAAEQSMKNLASTGANWIGLNVVCLQETYASTQIVRQPPCTATDAELIRMIDLAHSLGMKVMLRPQVGVSNNDPSHWSGNIGSAFNTEDQWKEWFASYREFINHYADFSQNAGADMLCLGVELGGVTHRETDWRFVIREVRERFKGPITYSSLCSAMGASTTYPHAEEKRIAWWDAVDFIGVSAYYKLTNKKNPTMAELKAAWTINGHITLLENLSKKFNKPIIFTEIGYESRDGTNIQPAHGALTEATLDLQEQADCYQAAIEVMFEKSWFKGMFWFQWFSNLQSPGASSTGTTFSPWNKPAGEVLKKYYLTE